MIKAKPKLYREVKYGNTVDHNGTTLKIVNERELPKDELQCMHCYFYDLDDCHTMSCIPGEREDMQHVVYQEVQ